MSVNTRKRGTAGAGSGRQAQRRQRTEARIVEAFGRIVARDGLYNVRVNHLMREAGVGKRQLYQYFGGLGGVAAAWSRAGMHTPRPRATNATPASALPRQSPAGKLVRALLAYAERLRASPVALAAVQSQLVGPAELADSLREVRRVLGEEQLEVFLGDERLREGPYVALYSVLYAAINYCALRARSEPGFNGMNLAEDEGWRSLLGMFQTVAALVEKGQGARRGGRTRGQRT